MTVVFLRGDKKHTVNGCSETVVLTNKSRVDIVGNSYLFPYNTSRNISVLRFSVLDMI
jgi:hypothetical protein